MANPYDMKESPNVGIIQRAGAVEQNILQGGWKDQLGKQFVDMAMQAQKEAAVARLQQDKQTYETGKITDKRAYDEGLADDKLILADETAADAQLEVPETAAGIAMKQQQDKDKGVMAETISKTKKNEADARKADRWRNTSDKAPKMSQYKGADGQMLTVDQAKIAKDIWKEEYMNPGDIREEVNILELEMEDKIAEITESTEASWTNWVADEPSDADQKKIDDIKASYKFLIEGLRKRGQSFDTSRSAPISSNTNEQKKARLAELRKQKAERDGK